MQSMKRYLMMAMFAASAMAQGSPTGVAFTLVNVGTTPLKAVTVYVTGRSYRVGDVDPGGTRAVLLVPATDSHVELGFADGRRLQVDCYLGHGYQGKLTARVTRERVVSIQDEIRYAGSY